MRTLNELINTEEPAWPMVQGGINAAKNQVEVLPASDPARETALVATQVTTRSPMGAIIYESGGLLVDHGWLRILGSGHVKLPRVLPDWNRTATGHDPGHGPFLLVADDVVGGFFAVDGGALGKPGHVFYFAPDTLKWQDLGGGYSDFFGFCLNGDLENFYKHYRWNGWQAEVAKLDGDQGLFIYPFMWAQGPPIGDRVRKPASVSSLYDQNVNELPKQMNDPKPGSQWTIQGKPK